MNDPVQVRFSGAGGQGLITAGVILAEAAMLEGKNVVQTQTYGPEARLGSSKAEVIISAGQIAYPEVTVPDVLLCMSMEAAKKYLPKVRPDTTVIIDSTNIGPEVTCGGHVHRLPLTQAAVDTGSKVVANTVALAAINRIAGLVSTQSLKNAVLARVPAKFRDLNERAIAAGEALVQTAPATA
ncbi:MAG: 2-oxoacid:acceptor oxidoreductase family protein [Planctomycetes bacterium]|nr:2-oxoacid:acceptor oxidoreductase family protein [Planctomycetota bacterium]